MVTNKRCLNFSNYNAKPIELVLNKTKPEVSNVAVPDGLIIFKLHFIYLSSIIKLLFFIIKINFFGFALPFSFMRLELIIIALKINHIIKEKKNEKMKRSWNWFATKQLMTTAFLNWKIFENWGKILEAANFENSKLQLTRASLFSQLLNLISGTFVEKCERCAKKLRPIHLFWERSYHKAP